MSGSVAAYHGYSPVVDRVAELEPLNDEVEWSVLAGILSNLEVVVEECFNDVFGVFWGP